MQHAKHLYFLLDIIENKIQFQLDLETELQTKVDASLGDSQEYFILMNRLAECQNNWSELEQNRQYIIYLMGELA